MFAERIDDVNDPAVVFAPVNPGRDRPARFDVFDQRIEAPARIGQVMEHADRERVIEAPLQRQTIYVSLNDVDVGQISRVEMGGLDRHAQVYSDHVTRSPQTREPGVAALAASAFEHDLVADIIPGDRRDPIQKLSLVMLLDMIEDKPLSAEILSREALRLIALDVGETRDARANRESRSTAVAAQCARDDL